MITIEKILFLKRISIFKSLTSLELRIISEVVSEEEFAAGEILFNEGQQGDCMYLLVEGKIAVYTGTTPKIKTLAVFEAGDFFGEMGLYDDKPRAASAMAREISRLLVLRKADFCELIAEYPEVALGIMKELNQRLRETNLKLNSFEGRILDKSGQLYTRDYFVECMSNEFLKAKKERTALAFFLIKLKKISPQNGGSPPEHLGEQLLCDLGRIMAIHQRPNDLAARFNTIKVVVMLAEANKDGAAAFQRRVKKDMDKHLGVFQETHQVTADISFIIHSFPDDTHERETMLALLEQC